MITGRCQCGHVAWRLDGHPGTRPALHVFAGSRAPWHEIRDALPPYGEFPPDDGIRPGQEDAS